MTHRPPAAPTAGKSTVSSPFARRVFTDDEDGTT
jgi:hypothetical protein